MPFDSWSGFCYNELHWTPKDFWNATIYDVVSAINYYNNKNTPKKENKMTVLRADKIIKSMKIKGLYYEH